MPQVTRNTTRGDSVFMACPLTMQIEHCFLHPMCVYIFFLNINKPFQSVEIFKEIPTHLHENFIFNSPQHKPGRQIIFKVEIITKISPSHLSLFLLSLEVEDYHFHSQTFVLSYFSIALTMSYTHDNVDNFRRNCTKTKGAFTTFIISQRFFASTYFIRIHFAFRLRPQELRKQKLARTGRRAIKRRRKFDSFSVCPACL